MRHSIRAANHHDAFALWNEFLLQLAKAPNTTLNRNNIKALHGELRCFAPYRLLRKQGIVFIAMDYFLRNNPLKHLNYSFSGFIVQIFVLFETGRYYATNSVKMHHK
jgi:hypothetical protein